MSLYWDSIDKTVTGSGDEITLADTITFGRSSALGRLGYNGRARAHRIHMLAFHCMAKTGDASAGVNCSTRFALVRDLDTEFLTLGRLGNNQDNVYESRYDYNISTMVADQFAAVPPVPVFHFWDPPIMVKPYHLKISGATKFSSSTGNDSRCIWLAYVQYEPVELSEKQTKELIIKTTSIGGAIPTRP